MHVLHTPQTAVKTRKQYTLVQGTLPSTGEPGQCQNDSCEAAWTEECCEPSAQPNASGKAVASAFLNNKTSVLVQSNAYHTGHASNLVIWLAAPILKMLIDRDTSALPWMKSSR